MAPQATPPGFWPTEAELTARTLGLVEFYSVVNAQKIFDAEVGTMLVLCGWKLFKCQWSMTVCKSTVS
jgi:hypothetical protein